MRQRVWRESESVRPRVERRESVGDREWEKERECVRQRVRRKRDIACETESGERE